MCHTRNCEKPGKTATNPTPIWDSPIYEESFRAVRDVNASLSGERKLRVLLGEPPIDWDSVRTYDDVGRWIGRRGTHAVEVIKERCCQSITVRLSSTAMVTFGGTRRCESREWRWSPPVLQQPISISSKQSALRTLVSSRNSDGCGGTESAAVFSWRHAPHSGRPQREIRLAKSRWSPSCEGPGDGVEVHEHAVRVDHFRGFSVGGFPGPRARMNS